jgi:hypothetical protein
MGDTLEVAEPALGPLERAEETDDSEEHQGVDLPVQDCRANLVSILDRKCIKFPLHPVHACSVTPQAPVMGWIELYALRHLRIFFSPFPTERWTGAPHGCNLRDENMIVAESGI